MCIVTGNSTSSMCFSLDFTLDMTPTELDNKTLHDYWIRVSRALLGNLTYVDTASEVVKKGHTVML